MNISITPEGVVSKEGAKLGIITDGVMYHYEPISRFVKGQIRAAYGNPDLAFQLGASDTSVPTTETAEGGNDSAAAPVQLTDEQLMAMMKERGLLPTEPAAAPAPAPAPAAAAHAVQSADPGSPEFKTDRHLALESLYGRVKTGAVSPPPPTVTGLGDKTPAYVAWVKANTSAEDFAAIYPRANRLPTLESHQADLAKIVRASKLGEGKGVEIRIG